MEDMRGKAGVEFTGVTDKLCANDGPAEKNVEKRRKRWKERPEGAECRNCAARKKKKKKGRKRRRTVKENVCVCTHVCTRCRG